LLPTVIFRAGRTRRQALRAAIVAVEDEDVIDGDAKADDSLDLRPHSRKKYVPS